MTVSRTFTLSQLVFFTEIALERVPMMRAMKALEIGEDATVALCSSEATRARDVVRLYWEYGGAYGPQLERYVDSVVASHPDAARPGAPRYSLGQLSWIHAVGLFHDDMVRDMLAIGVPEEVAGQLAAAAARHRTILGAWKECGQQHGAALERYMGWHLTSYSPGWPHAQPSTDSFVHDEAQHPAP